MFSQFHTPIPIMTPKGSAWAIGLIDYGPEWDLQWVTFIEETGECWTFVNQQIRQLENYTFGHQKHYIPQPKSNQSNIKEVPLMRTESEIKKKSS